MAEATKRKASIYNKKSVSYGIVNGFSALRTTFESTFTSFWMTEIGVSNVHLGVINTVKNLFNIWGNVINGVLMQKVRLPYGRYRSWMYLTMPIVLIANVAFFINWGFPDGVGKACFYGILITIDNWIFNLGFSAYTGLMIPLAPDPAERVNVAACRSQANAVGKILFSLAAVGIIASLNKITNSTTAGYSILAAIIMILITGGMVFLANFAKDVDPSVKAIKDPEEAVKAKKDNVSYWQMLKSVFSVEMLGWLLITLAKSTPYSLVQGLVAYYYLYVIGDNTLLTVYLSITTFLSLGGSVITPIISKKLGVKKVCLIGFAVYALTMLSAYVLGQNAVMFTILLSLGFIGYSLIHTADLALYSNVVDYTAITRGSDTRPFLSSLYMLGATIGFTVGGAALGFGLAIINFDKANVTPEMASGVRILLSVAPFIISLIGFIVTLFFKLDENKLRKVREEHGLAD